MSDGLYRMIGAAIALLLSGCNSNTDGVTQATPLNPNGYPKLAVCDRIELKNPTKTVADNIAKGDLRPFTAFGFTPTGAPGIFCPTGNYSKLDSRGGTAVSDVPDVCGSHSFSNADPGKMEQYNRILAANPLFQELTGCRAATYCEERYRKGKVFVKTIDPKCPNEPNILISLAGSATVDDLSKALDSLPFETNETKRLLTIAMLTALQKAKWDNAKLLINLGADINGRVISDSNGKEEWLESPLTAVFNQNIDQDTQIPMARWLFANGLNFLNPHAHNSLGAAAFSNEVTKVNFLLNAGAYPNGSTTVKEQDMIAGGNIAAATGAGNSPFYNSLRQAMLNRDTSTPQSAARAEREQRHALENAVTLYQAGGRFFVGKIYGNFYRNPNKHVASILLAAAHRENRLSELAVRIEESMVRYIETNPASSNEQAVLLEYIRAVQNCASIQPSPQQYHVKLCSSGPI